MVTTEINTRLHSTGASRQSEIDTGPGKGFIYWGRLNYGILPPRVCCEYQPALLTMVLPEMHNIIWFLQYLLWYLVELPGICYLPEARVQWLIPGTQAKCQGRYCNSRLYCIYYMTFIDPSKETQIHFALKSQKRNTTVDNFVFKNISHKSRNKQPKFGGPNNIVSIVTRFFCNLAKG